MVIATFAHRIVLDTSRDTGPRFGSRAARKSREEDGNGDSRGISRAIYVNGREIGWGYEAPREGLREAFRAALSAA